MNRIAKPPRFQLRDKFRRRQRRRHDPMLVLNMSVFNSDDSWNRIFNPTNAHKNGAR